MADGPSPSARQTFSPPPAIGTPAFDQWKAHLDHFRALVEYDRMMADRRRMETDHWKPDLERHRLDQQRSMDLGKEAIGFARLAIGYAILINGGGALAILTHLGGAREGAFRLPPEVLGPALTFFAIGLVAATLCAASAYVSQGLYADEREHPAGVLRLVAIGAWLSSLLAFLVAVLLAASAVGPLLAWPEIRWISR